MFKLTIEEYLQNDFTLIQAKFTSLNLIKFITSMRAGYTQGKRTFCTTLLSFLYCVLQNSFDNKATVLFQQPITLLSCKTRK